MGLAAVRAALAWFVALVVPSTTMSFTSSSSSSSSGSKITTARSLSSYNYMRYDRCLRVKIRENNDDDGNSYFYNGAYRSQGMLYLAYRLCDDAKCTGGGDSFLAEAEDVLTDSVEYTQGYCNACLSQCRRRKLNDNKNGNGNGNGNRKEFTYTVDCNTCVQECRPMLANYYEGEDETQYLNCQKAHADEDGLQFYSAAACDKNGELTIGLFYDADCTVKKDDNSEYGSNFGRNTFVTLQQLGMNCVDGVCDQVENSLECVDGVNVNPYVNDHMGVCRTYKKVKKEWVYAKPKRTYRVGLIIFSFMALVAFILGSYTYFVRHKRAATEKALLDANEKATTTAATTANASPQAEYAEMT